MIATHNMKVNGKWYAAGEELPEKKAKVKPEPAEKPIVMEEVPQAEEEPKAEEKPKTSSRRKKVSE